MKTRGFPEPAWKDRRRRYAQRRRRSPEERLRLARAALAQRLKVSEEILEARYIGIWNDAKELETEEGVLELLEDVPLLAPGAK